ncbi:MULTISPECIES: helix-turn-helix transcriptional regulator [Bacillota]|uniref:Helix-turn-helix transcriptional regulator n=1 Tax=Companilactobacillus halodurans TaxID=2584183 RepID=A0A5P0ZSY3_9LACO|nr:MULTISPECIES: helix-turn-helix transcriptional regulator [Bacillota]MCS6112828.1 ArsR family transcriptional regulator [Clostridium botulinum]MCS6168327.1 ArsR family transcriptional regulator [Clostridium botulinum]MQS77292.1 helix-turn-helix transcriptional regulator [Companilactobacillus halodurans]
MKTVKEVSELLDVSKQTIHYHLKSLPSNLKVKKIGNKSLIDDNTIDYLKTILNKKTTKESTKFDEKSTNKTESSNNQYNSYVDKYIEHLESEIRQKNRQIDDLTIALKQEQSLNLNSQNILGNNEKIETDNMHEKENIFESKISNQNEQKQSLFSKLFKKKN